MRLISIVLTLMVLLNIQLPVFAQQFNSVQITDYANGYDANVTSGNALKVDLASSSGTANVNVSQVGGSSTATGNGIAGSGGVQRVTIASDSTGQITLAAGSNLIGSVSQSGTWNIGTLTTLTSITNPVAVTGTFWQATQPVSGTVAVTQSTSPWVIGDGAGSITVDGTFWQATQPVSIAATVTVDGSGVTQPVSDAGGSLTVDGTFWQATQPISAASLPLPTGAATAAKQPALGTAGTASADVITVQGVASMTPLLVDGSGVTQPVSGTFWQATQPVSIAAAVAVTDNAGSLTVDGTVAATQSGTWNIGSITTLPSIPAGTNNIGDVDVASIAAGTNYIGKVRLTDGTDDVNITAGGALDVNILSGSSSGTEFAEDTAHTTGDAGIEMLAVRNDANAALSGTDLDYTPLATDSAGRLKITTGGVDIPVSGTFWQATQPVSIAATVTVDGSGVTQPVSGTFWQATQPVSGTVAATQSGTWSTNRAGVTTANETNTTGSVPSTSTQVNFTAAATTVIIKTTPDAAVMYFNFNGAATSSNFRIEPGSAYTYVGASRSSVYIIGATATGSYSIHAY